jgi:hypothetical protein
MSRKLIPAVAEVPAVAMPPLLSIAEIHERLPRIFPAGLEMRGYLVREMAAKVIWVFQYGGMVEGTSRYLRPSHIYFYTDEQIALTSHDERFEWVANVKKTKFRPAGKQWYADTTREPIRDETIRSLLDIGAVGKLAGVPTNASTPTYYLRADFAALFSPTISEDEFDLLNAAWQKRHLTPAARARMALLAAGKIKRDDEVAVTCPDGTVAKMAPGTSSLITKAVVENFSINFLPSPALLWVSEGGKKVRFQDDATARAIGLHIDVAKVLPDIIVANVGESGEDTNLIFIEVVATDGPMNQARKDALLALVRKSGFPESQCLFGTAFEDRAHSAFRKCLPTLAWGTFAWFMSEPDRVMWLLDKPFNITEQGLI